ncbi:MAG: hypothetical protein ACLURV_00905 [Gallintestinimicrobium sp.]
MQGRLIVSDNALRSVIEGYTREAGVEVWSESLGRSAGKQRESC